MGHDSCRTRVWHPPGLQAQHGGLTASPGPPGRPCPQPSGTPTASCSAPGTSRHQQPLSVGPAQTLQRPTGTGVPLAAAGHPAALQKQASPLHPTPAMAQMCRWKVIRAESQARLHPCDQNLGGQGLWTDTLRNDF